MSSGFPETVTDAVDCLVDVHGVDRTEELLQERVVEDNDRAKAGLSYLRQEFDREVTA